MLLEAFRRWGVFDRQLVDLLVERMTDEVDQFVPDEPLGIWEESGR